MLLDQKIDVNEEEADNQPEESTKPMQVVRNEANEATEKNLRSTFNWRISPN